MTETVVILTSLELWPRPLPLYHLAPPPAAISPGCVRAERSAEMSEETLALAAVTVLGVVEQGEPSAARRERALRWEAARL